MMKIIELTGDAARRVLSQLGMGPVEETPEPEKLEDSASGRDILAVVAELSKDLSAEFAFLHRQKDSPRYNPRVFVLKKFEAARKGDRSGWAVANIELASAPFFSENVEHLRTLMQTCAEHVDEKQSVSMWIHPSPPREHGQYFIYLRHVTGLECAYIADGSGQPWSQLPINLEAQDQALQALLYLPERHKEKWNLTARTQAEFVRATARDEAQQILARGGCGKLNDKTWVELTDALFQRRENVEVLKAISREMATPVVQETQHTLSLCMDLVEKALTVTDQKLAQKEKDHTRAINRFKADLQKVKMFRESSEKQARARDKELAELRRQVKASANQNGEGKNPASLAIALDAFFV